MFHFTFNLGESIPNATDWIQAICAFVMMCYAIKAVNTWKEDKYDNYIIQAEIQESKIKEIYLVCLSRLIQSLHDKNDIDDLENIIKETNESLEGLKFNEIIMKISKVNNQNIVVKKKLLDLKYSYNSIEKLIVKLRFETALNPFIEVNSEVSIHNLRDLLEKYFLDGLDEHYK